MSSAFAATLMGAAYWLGHMRSVTVFQYAVALLRVSIYSMSIA